MSGVSGTINPQSQPADASALLMLLAYVEAECRRIGASEAAGHAALAAAALERAAGAAIADQLVESRH